MWMDVNSSAYLVYMNNIFFCWFCVLVPERWIKDTKSDLRWCWHVPMYSRKCTWNYLCKCWTEDCGSVGLFALFTISVLSKKESSHICKHFLVTDFCEDKAKNPHSVEVSYVLSELPRRVLATSWGIELLTYGECLLYHYFWCLLAAIIPQSNW